MSTSDARGSAASCMNAGTAIETNSLFSFDFVSLICVWWLFPSSMVGDAEVWRKESPCFPCPRKMESFGSEEDLILLLFDPMLPLRICDTMEMEDACWVKAWAIGVFVSSFAAIPMKTSNEMDGIFIFVNNIDFSCTAIDQILVEVKTACNGALYIGNKQQDVLIESSVGVRDES